MGIKILFLFLAGNLSLPGIFDTNFSFRRIGIPNKTQIIPVSVQFAQDSNTLISYDDLGLELILSGRLERLIRKYGVKKVTFN